MTRETLIVASRRIAEHADRFKLPSIDVVFHGGEPLLAGSQTLDGFASVLTSEVGSDRELRLGLQTNGVLLRETVMRVLNRWDIKVGVSLDGTQVSHDSHRRYRGGAASYPDAARGIQLLASERYRHLFSGLLCVTNLAADPVECFRALAEFEPPVIDFLLPHANWEHPPPRHGGQSPYTYGDWLVAIFDAWYSAPRRATGVRLFEEIMGLLFGRPVRSDSVGLAPATIIVVETNGEIEQVDSLKSAYDGAAGTGLKIQADAIERALWHPLTAARQLGFEGLCETCRSCPLRRICGGGHFAHRYHPRSGFLNPSTYGPDLAKLISHIGARIFADLRMTDLADYYQLYDSRADSGGRCSGWTPER